MSKLDGIHPDPWQLVAELRAVLATIEWIVDYDGVRWCPSCMYCHPEHCSTCKLKAALDAAGN